MTIRELIRALEVYDSEKEVKLNDFHKGLDDIGVIKEVAEGHVEITRMGYGKEYFEKPLPTVDEALIIAIKISEMSKPELTAQEHSFFIAGFCECVKWMSREEATE